MKIRADPNQHCLLSGGDGVPAAAGGRGHNYAASLIQLYALNHPLQHAHPASAAGTVRHHQKGTVRYPTYRFISVYPKPGSGSGLFRKSFELLDPDPYYELYLR
jgi:hypothetical protein